MSNFEVISLSNDFHITALASDSIKLSREQDLLIEEIWKAASEKSEGKLFNGQIFCLVELKDNHLIGKFIDYKIYFAQLFDSSLKKAFSIEVVTVNGVTIFKDKVLIGKRSQFVTEEKGLLELAPSGGIDRSVLFDGKINFKKSLLNELWEETGIPINQIVVTPLFLIRKPLYSCEICLEMNIKSFVEKNLIFNQEEYNYLQWFSKEHLEELITLHPEQFVPLSIILFKTFVDQNG